MNSTLTKARVITNVLSLNKSFVVVPIKVVMLQLYIEVI